MNWNVGCRLTDFHFHSIPIQIQSQADNKGKGAKTSSSSHFHLCLDVIRGDIHYTIPSPRAEHTKGEEEERERKVCNHATFLSLVQGSLKKAFPTPSSYGYRLHLHHRHRSSVHFLLICFLTGLAIMRLGYQQNCLPSHRPYRHSSAGFFVIYTYTFVDLYAINKIFMYLSVPSMNKNRHVRKCM